MKVIRGKKALVTGAASGIGRAIALALAREGADLFLLDIDGPKLAGVIDEARAHGTEIAGRECDVSRPDEIGASVQALADAWGRLDILVNNAGVIYHGETGKMTDAQWERLLGINLHAPLLFIRRLLPLLLKQPESHVLNVCSIYGLVPKRKIAAYQMSKYALVGLSGSLRAEYAAAGLGITALCPGFVDTNLLGAARDGGWSPRRFNFPSFLAMAPERVAARAVRAIYRNQGLVVLSAHARFFWALHRLFPRL